MIIQIGTDVDESRILWKYKESDEWKRADIDDLIRAYEKCNQLTTTDVVEVVRCKDCKHWHSNTEFCGIWSFNFQNIAQRTLRDDYCSRAERREE